VEPRLGRFRARARAPTPDTASGFDRLVLFNWRNGLLAIAAGLLLSFLLFGLWYPYWRIADQDLILIYNALLLNDGLPQELSDHPGYLTLLELSGLYQLLHKIGVLGTHSISSLPPASDAAAFERAWMHLVQIGRLSSLLNALAFVAVFAFLLRRLVGDARIAGLGAFALAFSGGIAIPARSLKTELLSASLVMIAVLVLLIAARTPRTNWRPFMVGLAAMLSVLALQNKVYAVFVVGALPVLMLPFGVRPDAPAPFWRGWQGVAALAALALAALLLAVPVSGLVALGTDPQAVAINNLRPAVGGTFGVSTALIVGWLALGMAAFAILWRVPLLEAFAAAMAAVVGASLALLLLYVSLYPGNVAAVINPFEQLLAFAGLASAQASDCQSLSCNAVLRLLWDGVLGVIARRTFILYSSPRPTIFLEWVVIVATVIAFRRGKHKLALQAGMLMVTVWGLDTLGTPRDLKQEYFLYTDPLVIVAAALLLAGLVELQHHRWTYPIGATLIAVHIAISQAEPIKHSLMRSGPKDKCAILDTNLKRVGPFPFCRT
jgi:hypothetical protein